MSAVKKLWKSEHLKTVIAVVLMVGIILGLFFGLGIILGTSTPLRVLESGSMCVEHSRNCNGWSHPFEQTLHVGDILVIQRVNPEELSADYPNSDIIVYDKPNGDTPIVHRIVDKQQIGGIWYFTTKGDGNGPTTWPGTPDSADNIPDARGVPENLVEGRVILRIPYFGLVTLFLKSNPWGLPLIIAVIMILVFIEFIIPTLKKKKETSRQNDMRNQAQMYL